MLLSFFETETDSGPIYGYKLDEYSETDVNLLLSFGIEVKTFKDTAFISGDDSYALGIRVYDKKTKSLDLKESLKSFPIKKKQALEFRERVKMAFDSFMNNTGEIKVDPIFLQVHLGEEFGFYYGPHKWRMR